MRISKLVSILLLDSVASAAGWDHASGAQLRSILKKNDLTLVAFVAPWTEASKSLESEWISAAEELEDSLVSIDCVSETSLCEEYEVISYPAIRLFRGDESVTRYRGPRKASSIIPFMQRSNRPVVSTLDKASIAAFKSIDNAVFIGYYGSGDAELKSSFTTLASRNSHSFTFGISSSAALAKADGVALGCIVCHRTSRQPETLCGQTRLDVLQDFVDKSTTPLIGEMTRKNELKYLLAGKSIVYIFGVTETERSEYRVAFTQLATKYEEYLNFVIVDAIEYAYMAPVLGLKAGVFPALALQNPMLGQLFPYDQRREITPEAAEEFVLDIVQGKTKPISKTAGEEIVHDDL